MDIFTGILLIHLSLYSTLTGIHVQLHAITRCASESFESGVGLYPHCSEKTKFIYCIFGYAVERQCPDNLVFDIKFGVCNLPENSQTWNSNLVSMNTAFPISTNGIDPKGDVVVQNHTYSDSGQLQHTKDDGDILPKSEATQQPVSLKTDDPPAGIDSDGPEESSGITIKQVWAEESSTLKTDNKELATVVPDSKTDKDQQSLSMKTDDPPGKWNQVSTKLPNNPNQSKKTSTDEKTDKQNTERKIDVKADEMLNRNYSINPDFSDTTTPADVSTQKNEKQNIGNDGTNDQNNQQTATDQTDIPPEEWNRDYSINPDFPAGEGIKDPGLNEGVDSTRSITTQVPRSQVPCVRDCNGMPYGNYQSCNECTSFISCMWGIKLENSCVTGLFWDDISKQCVEKSTTCV